MIERVSALPWTGEHFELLPSASHPAYPWPAVVLGLGLVLGPAYWVGNQAIVQRTLGASERSRRPCVLCVRGRHQAGLPGAARASRSAGAGALRRQSSVRPARAATEPRPADDDRRARARQARSVCSWARSWRRSWPTSRPTSAPPRRSSSPTCIAFTSSRTRRTTSASRVGRVAGHRAPRGRCPRQLPGEGPLRLGVRGLSDLPVVLPGSALLAPAVRAADAPGDGRRRRRGRARRRRDRRRPQHPRDSSISGRPSGRSWPRRRRSSW